MTAETKPAATPYERPAEPDPSKVRGTCPDCGRNLVSDSRYVDGRGYEIRWACVDRDCGWEMVLE